MIDHKPFFSIIIPVYNASDYLEQCLQSILAQDFQDWEAILVDDGSQDDSMAIAEVFCKLDPRIKLFKSAENSGRAYTPRMRAAKLATGKYLVVIDADDKVSDNLLAIHHELLDSFDLDMVIPEMWRLDGDNSNKILPSETFDTSKTWTGKDMIDYTLCGWSIPMAGFAIRREIYLEADSRISQEEKKSIFADELLSRWILFLCRHVIICNARYYYRYNSESVTNSDISRIIDSTMTTCDSLISMTATTFGENSDTHIRAFENKFYWAIDLLRLINKNSKLDRKQKTTSIHRISSAMKNFDFSRLSEKVSPRYIALMHLPIPLARIALKILDPILTSQNGI